MTRRRLEAAVFVWLATVVLCAVPMSAKAANVTTQPSGSGSTWTWTWPPNEGTSGYVLQTDGTGVTTWTNAIPGGVVGTARKAQMSVPAATTTGSFTADQVVVATALNGVMYNLPSYSQTINLGTTGAGGMDTGTAPASGFVSLYAIYNPTTPATSILACAVATSTASVYGGANMPAGYTASGLIGIWPTNASKQFVPGLITDRHFSFQSAFLANPSGNNGAASLTSQTVTGVPAAATMADMALVSTQTGSTLYGDVSGDSTGTGAKFYSCNLSAAKQYVPWGIGNGTYSGGCTFLDIPLITSQTVYWSDSNVNVKDYLYAIGYRW